MNDNVSEFAPVIFGRKLTWTLHVCPWFSVLPVQLFDEIANWVPVVSATDEIVCVDPNDGFDRTIFTFELLWPTWTVPKLTDAGQTLRLSVWGGVAVGVVLWV